MEITEITVGQVLAVIARITRLWTFYTKITKAFNDSLDKKLKPLKDNTELVLKTQMSMMTHLIEGNHVDKMKELKKEVENKLIDQVI